MGKSKFTSQTTFTSHSPLWPSKFWSVSLLTSSVVPKKANAAVLSKPEGLVPRKVTIQRKRSQRKAATNLRRVEPLDWLHKLSPSTRAPAHRRWFQSAPTAAMLLTKKNDWASLRRKSIANLRPYYIRHWLLNWMRRSRRRRRKSVRRNWLKSKFVV